MMRTQRVRLVSFFPSTSAACAAPVAAEDISGTLNVTKLIVDDSRLVGDVTCTMTTTPCIQFGAPNITLPLRDAQSPGTANPDETATCNATSGPVFSDGISNGTCSANQPTWRVRSLVRVWCRNSDAAASLHRRCAGGQFLTSS